MEPLTHLLYGACLARAGWNRKTVLAVPLLMISAEIPDLDILAEAGGPIFGFQLHRGITHAFLGVPFDAAAALALTYVGYRCRQRWRSRGGKPAATTSPRWLLLFFLGCLGALSHILLDYTNAYGVRPFLPFSNHWYHWDIVSIIEPLMDVVLVLGLIIPLLLRLVELEVGVRRRPPGRAGAIVALLAVAGVWGVRDFEHRRALAALDALEYDGAIPQRVSAFPYIGNVFRWYGIAETATAYHQVHVDSLTPEVDFDRRQRTVYKKPPSPPVEAAQNSFLGRVYLSWADYPVLEVEPLGRGEGPAALGDAAEGSPRGYRVRLYDLRYAYPGEARHLTAVVELDSALRVTGFYFGGRVRRFIPLGKDPKAGN